MELSCIDSKRGEMVDDKQKIVENSDLPHRQQCYGQFLVDDSFMVPTKSIVHDIRGNLGSKMGLIRKRANNKFCEFKFRNQ